MRQGDAKIVALENLILREVNAVLGSKETPGTLYSGRKNIPFARSISRAICFFLLHNAYGYTYSKISRMSGLHIGSVMRCTKRMNTMLVNDKTAIMIFDKIRESLN